MTESDLIPAISALLRKHGIGDGAEIVSLNPVGGGCISMAYMAKANDGQCYFVKQHDADRQLSKQECVDMFRAEMAGLSALRQTNAIRVPEPIGVGELPRGAFLVTEYIHMRPLRNQKRLGEQLAHMHLAKGPAEFGFQMDNSIGSTPQVNTWRQSWVDFLHARLEFQFVRAKFTGHTKALCNELLARLPEFFRCVDVAPSLVHGDLWSGNCMADEHGEPVIFDPAAYWGHHEAELGIMRMFGGFSQDFFDAYHAIIPQAPGFKRRGMIYELYHTVNHFNLFGSGYLSQSERLLERILGQV
ncbi:Ketosamine-3-kinase [Martensiomyces pterosporus]|nr:Ketosamine-3-kinase [Martensiomyces pterosporus]